MRALFLVLVCVALVAVLVARRRGVAGLGVPAVLLALLALGLSLTFTLRPSAPAYVHRLEPFHRAVGYRLGQAVGQQFPEVAQILVLQDLREEDSLQRYAARQVEGLREGLGGAEVAVVPINMRDMVTESTRPPEEGLERSAVEDAYGRFAALVNAHPGASVIVSFVGYPVYLRLWLRREDGYRGFVWDVGAQESVQWEEEFAAGRVFARVTFRNHPDLQAKVTESTPLEEVFAMRYRLETAP